MLITLADLTVLIPEMVYIISVYPFPRILSHFGSSTVSNIPL